jgi:chromosome segregation and condensation protein ScpB
LTLAGYRNFFCAIVDSDDYRMMLDMQEAGLVEAGKRINDGRDQLFHATKKGCASIGISRERNNE